MKNIVSLFLAFSFFPSFSNAQSTIDWDEMADRMSENAERIAERIERQAERSAEIWESRSEKIAEEMERKFNRPYRVSVDANWPFRVAVGDICHAFLGIDSEEISREKAERLGFKNAYGSYVSQVYKGSAAEKAGLQPFDYIYGIEDQRTSDNQSLSDIIADHKPGEEVTLYFARNGQEMTVRATFTESTDFDWDLDDGESPFLGVSPHAEEGGDDLNGVTVEIVNGSTAAQMGLKDGDVITHIKGHPTLDWDDLSTAIATSKPGENIQVTFLRDGQKMDVQGPISARQQQNFDHSYGDSDWAFGWGNEDENESEDWDEEGAFLGIYTEKISESKARKLGFENPYGSYVTGIVKNTGADQAGLKPFDYIYGLDEYRVGENQNLGGILRKFSIGEKTVVHFVRKGEKRSANLTFGNREEAKYSDKNSCEDPFFGIIQTVSNTSADGVAIKPVGSGAAHRIGLQAGDVITHINGYPMVDWTDITTAIEMLNPGETIEVDFHRSGEKKKAAGKIGSYAEAKNCKDCDCGDEEDEMVFDFSTGENNGNWNQSKTRANAGNNADLSKMEVKMEDISATDTDALRAKGVEMPEQNALKINQLSLSPNPNLGMFELKFDLPTQGETSVRVFNPAGRAIYEYDLGRFSGDFSDNVDISQNGPGIYYLQVMQDGKAFSRKIVLTGK